MPPPPPPDPTGGPRYVYLLGRLRSRQITMEEATELFAVQQSMIRSASRASARSADPAGAAGTAVPAAGTSRIPPLSDEGLAFALLAIATGAGVLAAVMKRGRGDPPVRSPTPR